MTGAAGGGGADLLVLFPDLLRQAATGFDTAGDALEAAGKALEDALAAEQGCWGTDEPGESFATRYEPAAEQAASRFAELVAALHELRSTLDDASSSFTGTEGGNAGALGGGQ